jgi:hypothetical protein
MEYTVWVLFLLYRDVAIASGEAFVNAGYSHFPLLTLSIIFISLITGILFPQQFFLSVSLEVVQSCRRPACHTWMFVCHSDSMASSIFITIFLHLLSSVIRTRMSHLPSFRNLCAKRDGTSHCIHQQVQLKWCNKFVFCLKCRI